MNEAHTAQKEKSYGWIDMKFQKGTSIVLTVPMVEEGDSFISTVDLKCPSLVLSTSINYSTFLSLAKFRVFA